MTTIEQVKEFHDKFNQHVSTQVNVNNKALNDFCYSLIHEEVVIELKEALDCQDPVKILDALIDTQYVLDGTFLSLGFAEIKDLAFEEVHRSNMTKEGNSGELKIHKITKGPNYSPPDLQQFFEFPQW